MMIKYKAACESKRIELGARDANAGRAAASVREEIVAKGGRKETAPAVSKAKEAWIQDGGDPSEYDEAWAPQWLEDFKLFVPEDDMT